MVHPLALTNRFKVHRLCRQVQPTDAGKEADMGEAIRYRAGPRRPHFSHRRRPTRTDPEGLQPGKIGLVAEHQVAGGNAPAIKHLVSDVPILPGSVDQFLHVPAVLDLPGKESQLVEQSVEMHFLVDVGLIGLFLDDIYLFLFHCVLLSEFWA